MRPEEVEGRGLDNQLDVNDDKEGVFRDHWRPLSWTTGRMEMSWEGETVDSVGMR